jgi:RecA/RadA recombinase
LIIIDSVSSVFDAAYSRVHEPSPKQSDAAKWNNSRKYAVMADLVSRLQKLATINNLVVLMTQQTRMRIRSGAGALLLPVLSGVEWDNGISTQLVLFRDFPPKTTTQPNTDLLERWKRLRYAGVIKINGVSAEENGRFDTVVPFTIDEV